MERDDDAPGPTRGLLRMQVERTRIAPAQGDAEIGQGPLEEGLVGDATREGLELSSRAMARPDEDVLVAVGVPGDRDAAVGLEHAGHRRSPRPADRARLRLPGVRAPDYPVRVFEERPDIRARLEDETVIWLTTVNGKGQPQCSPVWFLSTPDHVVVYSLPDTPRVRNIRANPRVSLNLNSTPNGDELVIIEGRAEIIEGAPTAEQDDDYMAKYDEGIIREGMTAESFSRDYPVRIHVHPTRLRAS